MLQRAYEELKVRMNYLAANARKVPEDGWVMPDGTPWPGNNTRDHPAMIQVKQRVLLSALHPQRASNTCDGARFMVFHPGSSGAPRRSGRRGGRAASAVLRVAGEEAGVPASHESRRPQRPGTPPWSWLCSSAASLRWVSELLFVVSSGCPLC